MRIGDKILLSFFEDFSRKLIEYQNTISELIGLGDSVLVRLRAIADPTPTNNLKALSRPEPENIRDSITILVERAKILQEDLRNCYQQIVEYCTLTRVPCPRCNGKGIIVEKTIVRDEEFVGEDSWERRCMNCEGEGYLHISKPFSEQALKMFRSLNSFFS